MNAEQYRVLFGHPYEPPRTGEGGLAAVPDEPGNALARAHVLSPRTPVRVRCGSCLATFGEVLGRAPRPCPHCRSTDRGATDAGPRARVPLGGNSSSGWLAAGRRHTLSRTLAEDFDQ
jgi:hypothetical protein